MPAMGRYRSAERNTIGRTAFFPRHLAAPYLLDHRLMCMLEGLGPAGTTMYVYRPQRTPVSARVRLVFDALCELLDTA